MTLYHSPLGLHPFQAEGIAKWVLSKSLLCTWETGCGKSHLPLAGGSLLIEDGSVGLVVVVCEQNKLPEWIRDFKRFTDLRAALYMGTPKKREAIRRDILESPEPPQVIVTTYETSRNDIGKMAKVKVDGKTKKQWQEGPLMEVLEAVAQRSGIAIAYDESTRLGNRYEAAGVRKGRWVSARGSMIYKAHETMLKALRKAAADRVWVAALTGTPIETSPDNAFNQFRLVAPALAGSIANYEKDYVRYRDPFGKGYYKNLSPDDIHREPWVVPFSEKIKPILSHKRKDDPDVRAAFPEATEEPIYVTLTKEHAALYEAIEGIRDDPVVFPDGMTRRDEEVLFGILRQVAAHPMALALSPAASREDTLANLIVSRVGIEALQAIKSAKEEALVEMVRKLVHGQGSQVVVFSFFGTTLIRLLHERLEREGFRVAVYNGSMSRGAKQDAISTFREGRADIFLASDAASRGLNLPEAKYVINYELCLTHARTTQRINRLSRIDAGHTSITAFSMIALDTIEEIILRINLIRQEWHEEVLPSDDGDGDEGEFMKRLDASNRAALFGKIRRRSEAA